MHFIWPYHGLVLLARLKIVYPDGRQTYVLVLLLLLADCKGGRVRLPPSQSLSETITVASYTSDNGVRE